MAEANFKKKRVQDKGLLEKIRKEPCLACGSCFSDPHHLITRGASGDDVEHNLVALCRRCHTKIHAYGFKKFCSVFPDFREKLIKNGKKIPFKWQP